MRTLSMRETHQVNGAGILEDTFKGIGAWIADQIYDQAHSEHSEMVHALGASGQSEVVREMYPNDPLL